METVLDIFTKILTTLEQATISQQIDIYQSIIKDNEFINKPRTNLTDK